MPKKKLSRYNFNAVDVMREIMQIAHTNKSTYDQNDDINEILDNLDVGQLKDMIFAFIGRYE